MDNIAKAFREKKKWEEKMGIGSRDKLFDVLTGDKPNYDEVDYLGLPEPEDHHIDYDVLSKDVKVTKQPETTNAVTTAQLKAIEKYPSLVEMLGKDDSNALAETVATALNKWIITRIEQNSSSINKNAIECKEDNGTIKQYFKYGDRAGFVQAKGKFSGQEFIHYDYEKNEAMVLYRKTGNDFLNASKDFEIESQFVGLEEGK